MPQRRTGIKDLRQAQKRKIRNLDAKTDLRKITKKFLASVSEKKTTEAQDLLKTLYKKLDKAAKHNTLPKNTVSRRKSRYSKMIAAIG